MKVIFLLIALLGIAVSVSASQSITYTCPSIQDLANGLPMGWNFAIPGSNISLIKTCYNGAALPPSFLGVSNNISNGIVCNYKSSAGAVYMNGSTPTPCASPNTNFSLRKSLCAASALVPPITTIFTSNSITFTSQITNKIKSAVSCDGTVNIN